MTLCNLNTYDFLSIISIKVGKKSVVRHWVSTETWDLAPVLTEFLTSSCVHPLYSPGSTCTCFTFSGCSEAQRISRRPAAPPLGPVTQDAMLTVGGSTKPQISPFLGIDLFVTSGTGYNPPWGVDLQVCPCFRPGNWSEVRRGVAHRPF